MIDLKGEKSKLHRSVVLLSVLLLFFTIPHTLEDFATGEPAKAGIPAPVLSFVVATIFAIQAVGLHWLGEKQRRGYLVHVGIGIFWPLASGVAQLPTILSGVPYRSGFISIFYVVGIIGIALLLLYFSLSALRLGKNLSNTETN
ncbi:MAG: hypothetical protein ACC633_04655 [Anaerolineales bacterium]